MSTTDRDQIRARFPGSLGEQFTALPTALLEHAHALGLGPHELLVVWALETHRRRMGDEVFPSRERLQRLTRLSEGQVKRALGHLVSSGLITRRQPHGTTDGRLANNRYRLDGLWEIVAKLAAGQIVALPAVGHGRPTVETPAVGHGRPTDRGSLATSPVGRGRPAEVEAVRSRGRKEKTTAALTVTSSPEPASESATLPAAIARHGEIVYRELSDYATKNGLPAISKRSLSRILRTRQHRPLVRAVHDYLAWLERLEPGRRPKDLLGGYESQLDRRFQDQDREEQLDADGNPTHAVQTEKQERQGRRLAALERVTGRYDEYDRAAGLLP